MEKRGVAVDPLSINHENHPKNNPKNLSVSMRVNQMLRAKWRSGTGANVSFSVFILI